MCRPNPVKDYLEHLDNDTDSLIPQTTSPKTHSETSHCAFVISLLQFFVLFYFFTSSTAQHDTRLLLRPAPGLLVHSLGKYCRYRLWMAVSHYSVYQTIQDKKRRWSNSLKKQSTSTMFQQEDLGGWKLIFGSLYTCPLVEKNHWWWGVFIVVVLCFLFFCVFCFLFFLLSLQ